MARPTTSTYQSHINEAFVSTLDAASQINARDDPSYYTPNSLITTSTVHSFMNGTGSAIYRSLASLLESTNHELILVTCFWAPSSSLETLNEVLRKLSDKAVRRGTEKIRVRLCFSSLSIFQKLFHKQSPTGQTYSPEAWATKLGLPHASELSGLDLRIKSVFILPFSVMHPKFMIVDRSTVVLPSCNISWEEWFEGCVTFCGPIVQSFLEFYHQFWERRSTPPSEAMFLGQGESHLWEPEAPGARDLGHGHILHHFSSSAGLSEIPDIPTVFLPSPHRRSPHFRPFTSTEKIVAPPTPLNTFILTLFAKAERGIRIQTPNLTSPPVLSSVLRALERGIDVKILTSERLMILEQLVTAGTTTTRCVRKLIKRYRTLAGSASNRIGSDEEAAISAPRIGHLQISYFDPLNGPKPKGKEAGEPQQSHLKMTIVDDEVLVLGSGNLDRASWFTSQELGVAFFDQGLVARVRSVVDQALEGRTKVFFDSQEGA